MTHWCWVSQFWYANAVWTPLQFVRVAVLARQIQECYVDLTSKERTVLSCNVEKLAARQDFWAQFGKACTFGLQQVSRGQRQQLFLLPCDTQTVTCKALEFLNAVQPFRVQSATKLCVTGWSFKSARILPHDTFICLVWISEQTARRCVHCAVRGKFKLLLSMLRSIRLLTQN